MPPSGSTGSATEYASSADAFSAIDELQAEVALCLRRLPAGGPSGRFAASLQGDLERHRLERDGLRRQMRLGPARAPSPASAAGSVLDDLRAAQEKLMYAHAEALPALEDPRAVRTLARHLVDLSRHLTLVSLWIEAEEERG